MKHDNLDHAPIVESWLKEPTLLPPSDTARLTQLVHQTPQQRRWWQRFASPGRTHTMFNVFKFAAASVILAVTGGFLFSTFLAPQDAVDPLPAAETPSAETVTAEPLAEEEPTTSPLESVEVTEPEPVVAPVDVTRDDALITFGPGSGERVGVYTQVGSVASGERPDLTEMFDLQSIGGLLVARSQLTSPGEGLEGVILYSDDAINWARAQLPGSGVEVLDLVATADGLMAAGSVDGQDGPEGRLWSSLDGVEWTAAGAPSVKRVQQIVSADGADTLVRSGNQIWIDDGTNGEWRIWNKVGDMTFLSGPGGIVAYEGGGQDLQVPTRVMHWADPQSAISEVRLPEALDWGTIGVDEVPANMGIQIFALDDRWVMVGSESKAPDELYVSMDGLEWESIPRPPEMAEGLVRWIDHVDGQLQGQGTIVRDGGSPNGIWSWEPGVAADAPETLASTDAWFDAPVPFNGGYVANGWDRGRDQALTLWSAGDAVAVTIADDTAEVPEVAEAPAATTPRAPRATGQTDARFTVRDPDPDRGLVTWKDRASDEDGYRIYARRIYCGLVPGADPNQPLDTDDFTQRRSRFVRVGKVAADAEQYRPVHQNVRQKLPEIPGQQYGSGEIYELYSAAFNEAGESKRVLVGTYITTPEFMCP